MNQRVPTALASYLIKAFNQDISKKTERGITVNPIVSEIAAWYEKLRNAMDYREDEVILRATIERILKRRLILRRDGNKIASPLIRELIWARYFPDGSVPESIIEQVAKTIDLYLELRDSIFQNHPTLKEGEVHLWIHQLLSSEIAHTLNPNKEEEAMSNFMFHVFKDSIDIPDDSEQAKNVQIFIAVRRSYAKDDTAFLRYHLFLQYFGEVNKKTIPAVAARFSDGYTEIEHQLNHPFRHKFLSYIARQTPPFLILEDLLRNEKGTIHALLPNEQALNDVVFATCEKKYQSVISKVHRAIIRSVIFILLSKAFFALAIEGTYENIAYGKILWGSMALNVFIPPFLMVIAGTLIKTPDQRNSMRILAHIETLLFEKHPRLSFPITLKRTWKKKRSLLDLIFTGLWLATFILSFGLIVFILSKLHFNLVSQAVFLFFIAIVSFFSYRIYRIAHTYSVESKQSLGTPIVDFFFMPIAQVGRYLTEGITQINVFLFILDYVIETPFKGIFSFFEQWFLFLHAKREQLE